MAFEGLFNALGGGDHRAVVGFAQRVGGFSTVVGVEPG